MDFFFRKYFEVNFPSLAVNELRSGRKIDSRAGL